MMCCYNCFIYNGASLLCLLHKPNFMVVACAYGDTCLDFQDLTWILDDLKRLLDQTQLQPGFVSSLAQALEVLYRGENWSPEK